MSRASSASFFTSFHSFPVERARPSLADDSYVVNALRKCQDPGTPKTGPHSIAGDYSRYCAVWMQLYEQARGDVVTAVEELGEDRLSTSVQQTEWFRRRVFDQYLWGQGAAQKK